MYLAGNERRFTKTDMEYYGSALVLIQRNMSVAVPNSKPNVSYADMCS
jgi:hypothetical protein